MHTRMLSAVFLVLLLSAASSMAGSDIPVLRPAVHDELTQAWDELTRQLHGLGNRWREHFTRSESRAEGERPLITFMLRHREELKLSPEQIRTLERLKSDFQREAIRREADLRIAESELATLMDAETIDLGQVETKVREIERLRGDLRLARIRAIEKGKAELTAEQHKKLQTLLSEPRYTRLR